ncbi:hypothetical protein TrLO_g14380 [Triparma laevis f. longispina]|uniref:Uncharacterized protein n=1 Tax=Triparma laevis f. longispina TaxID=1714387 RepID=A0A9W7FVN0_9STRA|nr:hypothetical protein TrLO_g14380 [Triparma laevis f. longispina]
MDLNTAHEPSSWRNVGPVPYRLLSFPPQPKQPPFTSGSLKKTFHASLPNANASVVFRLSYEGKGDLYILQNPQNIISYPPLSSSSNDDIPYNAVNTMGFDSSSEILYVILDNGTTLNYRLRNFLHKDPTPVLTFDAAPTITQSSMVRIEKVHHGHNGGGFAILLNDYHLTRVTFQAEGEGSTEIKTTMPEVQTVKTLTSGPDYRPIVTPLGLKRHCNQLRITPTTVTIHPSGALCITFTNNTVISVDLPNPNPSANFSNPKSIPFAPTKLSYSHNGNFCAMLASLDDNDNSSSTVIVTSSDFASVITRFTLPELYSKPTHLTWSGDDAVVAVYPLGFGVLGPYGDWTFFDGDVSDHEVLREIDGLRFTGVGGQRLLHRVPKPLVDIFTPGSIHPASLLVGEGEGTEGVEDVVDALCDVYGETRITLANAVRGKGGIATANGFKLARVISTLEKRGYYGSAKEWKERKCLADDVAKIMPRLGVEVGKYLGTGGGKGVVGMIEAFVLQNKTMPANELTHNVLLIAKAHPLPSLLSLIALYLHDVNVVASKQVLQLETDPTSKTMAMCEMKMHNEAAGVACESNDGDLMAYVLHSFEKHCGKDRNKFYSAIATWGKGIRGLVKSMASEGETKEIMTMLIKADDILEAGNSVAKEYLEERAMGGGEGKLEEVKKIWGLKQGAGWKERAEEEELLIKEQKRLTMVLGDFSCPINTSVIGLISAVIKHARVDPRDSSVCFNEAGGLSKKFKLTERRFLTAKLWALGESQQWGSFRAMSAEAAVVRQINTATFAKIAAKFNQPSVEIGRYVSLVSNKEQRFRLYIEVGDLRGAAEEAVKSKDVDWAAEVGSLATGTERDFVADILKRGGLIQ